MNYDRYKRHVGKVFKRRHPVDNSFQTLIFGCLWIWYMEGNFKTFDNRRDNLGGTEYFDGCVIIWSDCVTHGMPRP